MLIDGDNAQYRLLEQMLEEASRYGTVTIRRAYGDWTQPNLSGWRAIMLAHAIQPIQQWRYTTGKNATDSALIIDAMDILYAGKVQGFCIVSSDSDYTRLCTRIRESGLFVMGLGQKKTPEAFIKACDVFVYVENLTHTDNAPRTLEQETVFAHPEPVLNTKPQPPETDTTPALPKDETYLTNLIHRAMDIAAQDDGWAHLGALGQALQRLDPSFDSRTYGYKSLSLLIKAMPKEFVMVMKESKKTGTSSIYVRVKE